VAYSGIDDLLIGDLLIPDSFSKEKFIGDAADEIDARLGYVYVLPLTQDGTAPLPDHELKLLKLISNKMASGRLILALDVAGEDTALHAYGYRLVTEANNDLMALANGAADLTAVRRPVGGTVRDMAPAIVNHDEESAVDMFEATVMRGEPSYWNPGTVKSRPGYVQTSP